MISIIVPVYNVEQYLSRCLESIINQTFSDFEAIIVDDGSTDKSGVICDEYALKDSRLKVFHKQNGGLPSARNHGLEHLNPQTDFVCFLDSDDNVENTWLEDYINNYNGEDVLIQNSRWWKGDEIMLERKISLNLNNSLLENMESLASRNSLHVWAAMWKASIIKEHNIRFPEFQYWEDVGFCFIYYRYVNSISVIPNNKLHAFNYNYYYPTTHRKYNDLTINWFKVKCATLDLWIDLCNKKGHYNINNAFGNSLIYDLLLKLSEVYKNNIFNRNEELALLNYIQKETKGKYKLKYKPIKLKIISRLLNFNTYLAHSFIKMISRI